MCADLVLKTHEDFGVRLDLTAMRLKLDNY